VNRALLLAAICAVIPIASHSAAAADINQAKALAKYASHYRRTGVWPQAKSGPVGEAPGETWDGIDMALA
jgi:hypothetical protein